jgi:uncharacterized membrane protein YphA (DoxX/SURF4 family)
MKSIIKNLYKILQLMVSSFNSTANFLDNLLKLAIRCAIAKVIITSGVQKLDEFAELLFSNTGGSLELSRQDIYEICTLLGQVVLGAMLVVGLGTRYVAATLLGVIFYYSQLEQYTYQSIILASLLTGGAGRVSLDNYIADKTK